MARAEAFFSSRITRPTVGLPHFDAGGSRGKPESLGSMGDLFDGVSKCESSEIGKLRQEVEMYEISKQKITVKCEKNARRRTPATHTSEPIPKGVRGRRALILSSYQTEKGQKKGPLFCIYSIASVVVVVVRWNLDKQKCFAPLERLRTQSRRRKKKRV